MSRSARLGEGPRALLDVITALARARPDVVNASTAKAGLLGMIAARLLGVRARVYLVRGTLLETKKGVAHAALLIAERIAIASSHHVVCVSASLRDYYREIGLLRNKAATVIPSNGIDLSRFRDRATLSESASAIRAQHAIPPGAKIVGFVGRLVSDKGVADMIAAMERVDESGLEPYFLVVGGDLAGDTLPVELDRRLRRLPRVVFAGRVDETAPYYAAMNVLLFPSYREGLPNVPLEAAACGVPTVGYRVTGVRDAVIDGSTGSLVNVGDHVALGDAVIAYLRNPCLEREHGNCGRQRVVDHFEQHKVWTAWLNLYGHLLSSEI